MAKHMQASRLSWVFAMNFAPSMMMKMNPAASRERERERYIYIYIERETT